MRRNMLSELSKTNRYLCLILDWVVESSPSTGETVALLVARRTNNRKVVGSRPTKVVRITVLTGNHMGWTARCGRPPLLLPSCRKLEFRPSALMDSDLAWVNGKSGRQSWRYADAFQRSMISGAIYHFFYFLIRDLVLSSSVLAVSWIIYADKDWDLRSLI